MKVYNAFTRVLSGSFYNASWSFKELTAAAWRFKSLGLIKAVQGLIPVLWWGFDLVFEDPNTLLSAS